MVPRESRYVKDIAHEKKTYGFTPNLGFNPVFTKFNINELLQTSIIYSLVPSQFFACGAKNRLGTRLHNLHQTEYHEYMQHIKGKEN